MKKVIDITALLIFIMSALAFFVGGTTGIVPDALTEILGVTMLASFSIEAFMTLY